MRTLLHYLPAFLAGLTVGMLFWQWRGYVRATRDEFGEIIDPRALAERAEKLAASLSVLVGEGVSGQILARERRYDLIRKTGRPEDLTDGGAHLADARVMEKYYERHHTEFVRIQNMAARVFSLDRGDLWDVERIGYVYDLGRVTVFLMSIAAELRYAEKPKPLKDRRLEESL